MAADGEVLDFNRHIMREAASSDAVNAVVDAGLTAKRAKQTARTYLGASAIGDACARRVQFEYAGAPREKEFEGKTLRIFDRGHTFEELAAAWLIDAGFELSRWNARTKSQHGFAQMDGRFKGHVDGVLISGPEIAGLGYPCLWEHKAVGGKTFNAVAKHGLAKERPIYADQVAIYQAYLTLTENPCLFTITNADTCEQLHLLIPFDAERAQAASDRAVKIVEATDAGELLPRPFSKSDHFECRFCAWSVRCWGMAK